MASMDDKLAEWEIANLEEQFSSLAREAGFSPPAPPTGMKTGSATLASRLRSADWRYAAFAGSLLAASIGVAAWWWSSQAHTTMVAPSAPISLTQAAAEAAAPKDAAPAAVTMSAALEQQLQPMARDLAALRQTVEQLKVRQEQLVRDNETLARQFEAGREEMARNNGIIDQIKSTQIEMARESQTLAERVNASQEQLREQLARVAASPSESKLSPEAPKVMPEIPLPRPRQSASVARTQKPAPSRVRPQATKPQPSWPWSPR